MMTRLLLPLCLLLACGRAEPDAAEPAVIHTALVDDERWGHVDALDVLVLDGNASPCTELLSRPLADRELRARAVATSRSCDPNTMSRVMGRVSEGKRSIVVIATTLAEQCTDNGKEELEKPGFPLAVGCEDLTAVAGTNHRVDVELFPWRDP